MFWFSEHDGLGSILGGDSNIMKRVCWFFLTVYLAMSVAVDLFPSMGSFCDLGGDCGNEDQFISGSH